MPPVATPELAANFIFDLTGIRQTTEAGGVNFITGKLSSVLVQWWTCYTTN